MLAGFSVSARGVLVYSHEGSENSRLIWLSRDGKQSPVIPDRGYFRSPRLSPDATRLAVTELRSGNADVWQIDLLHQFQPFYI
jgi:Tol biopolymer transport system component